MRTRKKKVKQKEVPEVIIHYEDEVVRRYKSKVNSPLTAIRAHCVECMGGGVHEVKNCTAINCALHPLRMGLNTFDKRVKRRLEQEQEDD